MTAQLRATAIGAAYLITTVAASAASLSTGFGEGKLTIEDIDGFGTFFGANFNPVGPLESGDPIFSSYVAITQGNQILQLGGGSSGGEGEGGEFEVFVDEEDFATTDFNSVATFVSETQTQAVSTFNINQLDFTLTQTVTDATVDGTISGAVLTQTYTITNIADVPNSFSLIRYLDGDLRYTDDSLIDGGGRIVAGGQEILFETDATGSEEDAQSFVGITATGGTNGGFSIADCCGINEFPLPNTVDGDTDGDEFIDEPYDVTLQLARNFSLAAGETQVFTTQTLFGNAEPVETAVPTAGLVSSQPLLPTETIGTTEVSFVFDIPIIDVLNIPEDILFSDGFVSQTIWIDPIIATGYTYEVTGADFASVTAPDQGTGPGEVNDADGVYQVLIGGTVVAMLNAGETYTFAAGVTAFEIAGIDIGAIGFGDGSEELDPNNPLAFNTGVQLTNFTTTTISVTQTAVTLDIPDVMNPNNPSVVPLPASVLLLGGGLLGLGVFGRRRKA